MRVRVCSSGSLRILENETAQRRRAPLPLNLTAQGGDLKWKKCENVKCGTFQVGPA
jgi:hypothetical protein